MIRREPIRGLLFVPRPNEKKFNFNHFDNTTLIKNKSFWEDLLKEKNCLGFNSISLNYGIWETKQARSEDKYAMALKVQYSTVSISRQINHVVALHQALQLQTNPNLY
jgi:hypothetical protein